MRYSLVRKYSQTCELRPPKGLGISDPISRVVSFARFGSNIFNTEFYTCPCTSQRHQRSAVPTCTQGRNWQRPCQAELVNVTIARSECLRRKSWTIEKYFSLNLMYVVAFHRLNRHFGPTSGVRDSHFSGGRNFKNALRTFESQIEGTEIARPQFSGGRFCQVVARTGLTVLIFIKWGLSSIKICMESLKVKTNFHNFAQFAKCTK